MGKPDDLTEAYATPSAASSRTSCGDSDEGSLSDYQYRFETDWCLGSISPNPNRTRGYRPGTTFTIFCASILPNLRKPLSFSLQLRCQVELYTARLGHRFGEPEPPDWHRCDDKHEILLDSLQLDVDAEGQLPTAINEVQRGKYRVPPTGECACGSGGTERSLPSSNEDGPVIVRYWFDLTAQTVPDGKPRSGWKGKLASFGDKQYSLQVPVRIVSDKFAPPILPPEVLSTGLDIRDLDCFHRGEELYTTRHFLEKGPQPLLTDGLPCPTLRLIHGVTTNSTSSASLSFRFEVSAGVHFGKDLLQTELKLAGLALTTDFRLVRRTTIALPLGSIAAAGDAAVKGKGKAKALPPGVSLKPLVDEVTIGRVRTDRHHVRRDMRLSESEDEPQVRAYELFLVFEGDLVLQPNDFAQGLPRTKSPEKPKSPPPLPIRVEICHAEVRYDLIAELGIACRDSLRHIRACDVRIDAPGTSPAPDLGDSDDDLEEESGDSDSLDSKSADAPRKGGGSSPPATVIDADRFPALAALYGTGSSLPIVAAPAELDQTPVLPPYEQSSSAVASTSYQVNPSEHATGAASLDVSHSLPRAVFPDAAAPPSYQSSQQSPALPGLSSSSPRGRSTRLVPNCELADSPSAAPLALEFSSAIITPHPAASTPPAIEPPSWIDAVQEDIDVDWAVASLALGSEDAPESGEDSQTRASRSRSDAR